MGLSPIALGFIQNAEYDWVNIPKLLYTIRKPLVFD
jgi:hypothetical protein